MGTPGQSAGPPLGRTAPAQSRVATDAARARAAQQAAEAYAEQVRLLYTHARTAALANFLNATILVVLLWETGVHRDLLGWLCALVLVQGARLALTHLYETDPQHRASGLRSYLQTDIGWDRAYLATVAAGGLLWGFAGVRFFPQQAIDHQLTLIFVIGGTVAGATAVLAPLSWAFSLFALPALMPLGVRFFMEGTPHYMAMGVLTFIFLVVLLNVANSIHKTLTSSIALRLDNKDLVAALTAKAGNLQQINQLLGARIDEHKAAQEQFRDQLLFLQQLMDAIPNPVYYKDTNGVYQGCNEALTKFLGISKNDFVGKTVFGMVPRQLAEEHQRKDCELLEHGGIQIYESPVKAANGTTRHILFHKSVFRDPLDRILGIIGTLVDLTEREQAEKALHEAIAKLAEVQGTTRKL